MKRIATATTIYLATLLTFGQQAAPAIPKSMVDSYWATTTKWTASSDSERPAVYKEEMDAVQKMRDVCGAKYVLTQASNGHDFVCVAKG